MKKTTPLVSPGLRYERVIYPIQTDARGRKFISMHGQRLSLKKVEKKYSNLQFNLLKGSQSAMPPYSRTV